MRSPRTSVISVSYRGSADTAACLRSLRRSVSPVTIVVIDTTPHDPDLCGALEFASDVRLIRASGNIGYGRACNLGIEWTLSNTDCELLLFLNNDAFVFPETIGILEAAMEAYPEVGIMAPRIACLNNPAILWYGGGEMDWRRASAFTPGFNAATDAPLAMTERDVTFASGCALLIRRSVAMRLGGFDPRFFMYEEDVEFCLRALENRIRIRYIPESLVLHRAQGSSRNTGADRGDFWSCENGSLPFYAFHVMRNRMLNIRLHAHGWSKMVAIAFFPLMLVRRAVPFLLGGRADAVAAMFRGIADSFRTGGDVGTTFAQVSSLGSTPNKVAE